MIAVLYTLENLFCSYSHEAISDNSLQDNTFLSNPTKNDFMKPLLNISTVWVQIDFIAVGICIYLFL